MKKHVTGSRGKGEGSALQQRAIAFFIKAGVTLGVVMVLVSGCAVPGVRFPKKAGLPEYIYTYPQKNRYHNAKVGIFLFTSPPHAPRAGYDAARILYKRLLEKQVFYHLFTEIDRGMPGPEARIEIGRKRGYDLIITGEVSYCFDGSLVQESRVDQKVEVIEVASGEVICGAKAKEVGNPIRGDDYILFRVRGDEAPSTAALMEHNASKFCNMFFWVSPRYSALTEDMKLVDDGYSYLIVNDYERAMWYFEKARALEPYNMLALVGLGIIYEARDNLFAAKRMYRKVVASEPKDLFTEFSIPSRSGQRLASFAEERLEALEVNTGEDK